jgi:YidC/Oxa1 family membrane protein insertase
MFAFILILATVAFFTSPTYNKFYYNKILKQPYPEKETKKDVVPNSGDTSNLSSKTESSANDTIKNAEEPKTILSKDAVVDKKGDTIWVETEAIIVGISEIGARIVSLQMKEYCVNHGQNHKARVSPNNQYVELITPKSLGGAGVMINNTSYDGVPFSVDNNIVGKKVRVKKGEQNTIAFVNTDAQGKKLTKEFSFTGTGYNIGLKITNDYLMNCRLKISWPAGITESEKKAGFYQGEERKAHYFDGQEVLHLQSNKPTREDISGFYKWVGISSKYFFVAIVADTARDADIKIIANEESKEQAKDGKENKTKSINYEFSYQFNAQSKGVAFTVYAGPSRIDELKKSHLKFEKILFPVLGWTKVFFWADRWFPWLAEFVLWLLLVLYRVTKDYGISILLLTVLSRVVTYPLTQSSMKSMNRMKDLQPKINILRQKHKGNPTKMNQEIMALYKQEGVNPLNPGCLPMFLQMPIFIALFVVLRKAIELRGTATVIVPWVQDLSQPESLFSFNTLIPGGIPLYGSNFAILPIIMAVLTFFQNKMTIKDPNQKMMIYFMPPFMLVLFNNFPSGLVLYWTFSSGLALVQQYFTDKRKNRNTMFEKGKRAIIQKT